MKQLLLLALLATLAFAQSYKEFAVKYKYETNYEQALKLAKAQKKDIMLFEMTNYCPWCKKMEKKVLAKKSIDAIVQKNYIPLIVNREEGGLPKQFATPIVPVTYIISYKDEMKFRATPGFQNKHDFMFVLQKGSTK